MNNQYNVEERFVLSKFGILKPAANIDEKSPSFYDFRLAKPLLIIFAITIIAVIIYYLYLKIPSGLSLLSILLIITMLLALILFLYFLKKVKMIRELVFTIDKVRIKDSISYQEFPLDKIKYYEYLGDYGQVCILKAGNQLYMCGNYPSNELWRIIRKQSGYRNYSIIQLLIFLLVIFLLFKMF